MQAGFLGRGRLAGTGGIQLPPSCGIENVPFAAPGAAHFQSSPDLLIVKIVVPDHAYAIAARIARLALLIERNCIHFKSGTFFQQLRRSRAY